MNCTVEGCQNPAMYQRAGHICKQHYVVRYKRQGREQATNHGKPWTTLELQRLIREREKYDAVEIARRHGRTVEAIYVQCERLAIGTGKPEGWTAASVGELLGVHPHTISKYIRAKLLPATKIMGGAFGTYVITEHDLRAFLTTHPDLVQPAGIERGEYRNLVLDALRDWGSPRRQRAA